MKDYDIFEQFDGYAFGVIFDEMVWDIIIGDGAKNVWEVEDRHELELVDTFEKWLQNNSFPDIKYPKDVILFFEFTLLKNDQIKTNKNVEIFKKAKNYFTKNKQIILDELKRLSQVQKEYNDFVGELPKNIEIGKWQLEPTIVVEMSRGLPQAYIKMLDEMEVLGSKSINYFICEAGSKNSERVHVGLVNWCKTLNKLIKDNIELFMDEEYYETQGDRDTADQVRMGVPFDQIGSISPERLMKIFEDKE